MKPSLLHILQAIKTGSWGRSRNEVVIEGRNAGLVPRPSEITLMVRLQLVSSPDSLTREPD